MKSQRHSWCKSIVSPRDEIINHLWTQGAVQTEIGDPGPLPTQKTSFWPSPRGVPDFGGGYPPIFMDRVDRMYYSNMGPHVTDLTGLSVTRSWR